MYPEILCAEQEYSEPVEYMSGFEVSEEAVKGFLVDKALEW